MGGEQSSTSRELYNVDDYNLLENTVNQRYGPIKVLQNKHTEQLVCEMSQTINSEDFYEQKVQHCAGRKQLQHDNLVNFINYSADKSEEFCSTFWKVQMLYEFLDQDLKEQIAIRSANNLRFREGELWYLLQSSINGLIYLKEKDIIHGDIRPQQILLTNDGRVKLGEHFQQNKPLTAYQQFLMDIRKSEFYIAPQLFESLRDKNYQHQYDAGANDVFALGMTILEAAILVNTDVCYSIEENYVFKCDKLQELLHILQHLSTPRFHSIISRMLIETDQDRPTLEDLKGELDILTSDDLFKREIGENLPVLAIDQIQHVPQQEQDQQQQYESQVQEQYQHQVEEPQEEQEEHIKRAAPSHKKPEEQQQHQQIITQQQPMTQSQSYDMSAIDDRISKVLAMSRETVKKYGGEKAYRAYETYENSQGYEPVRSSKLQEQEYKSQIYNVNPEIIQRSAHKSQEKQEQDQQQQQVPTTTSYNTNNEQKTYTHSQNYNHYQAPQSNNNEEQVKRSSNHYNASPKTTNTYTIQQQEQTSQQHIEQPNRVISEKVTTTYQPAGSYTSYEPKNSNTYVTSSQNKRIVQHGSSYQPLYQQQQEQQPQEQSQENNQKPTNEDLDQQIQRSLNRSKQIEEMIKSTKQVISSEQ